MKPVHIYYHVAQMGDWKEVVSEQLRGLRESKLYNEAAEIRVGVVGAQKMTNLPNKCNVMFHIPILQVGEVPTLEALHQRSLKEDFAVLYLHTKGVSWREQGYDRKAMEAWRRYLEHFCVRGWRKCAALLDEYDASGCELVPPRDTSKGILPSHFRGNFWWSKSSYLKHLPRVADVRIPLRDPRRKAEYWLGNNPNFKPASVHNLAGERGERGWLYHHVLDRAAYTKDAP